MRIHSVFGSCAVHAAIAASVAAQCALQPLPAGTGVPSLDNRAYSAVSWDPDGAGPAPAKLLVAGAFSLAGDAVAPGIAAFDPATSAWTALPTPPGATLAVLGGALVAMGINELSLWTGTSWLPFGMPLPVGQATAVAAASNGDVLVATSLGGTASLHRFTGGSWQLIGSASGSFFYPTAIRALTLAPNGDVVAAGLFSAMNGVATASIARWNGTSWSPLGAGVGGIVWALASAANGDLFAGGWFTTAGGVPAANVARWDGANWSPLGAGTSSSFAAASVVRALLVQGNGDLIAGGEFSGAGGIPANNVARWNGAAWSAMGTGIDPIPFAGESTAVYTLAGIAGEVFAGGNFVRTGGLDAIGLARWNGSAWGPVRGTGIGNVVTAVHVTATGDSFIGGAFRQIDGVLCNGIARRVANTWQPLGTGLGAPTPFAGVAAIASDRNGDLVVGGYFTTAGGVAASSIARWNGGTWLPLGAGLTGSFGNPPTVASMHAAANGDLWIAGAFAGAGGLAAEGIARWDGTAWSTLPPGLAAPGTGMSFLDAVAVMPNGDVVVAGDFALGGVGQAKLARWNGASWQLLGGFDGAVRALLPLPNGDLLVGGSFSQIFGVQAFPGLARWSNGSWFAVGGFGSPTAGNEVQRLARLPGGDVVAAGVLLVGGQYADLARWDGASWTVLADAAGYVADLAVDPRGELVIAGHISALASTASAYVARLATPCPAAVVASGSVCSGSGGQNVLATSALPWLGTTFESTATGMPATGLALSVLGLGVASTPLASILPQGAPGCTLLAAPDLLAAYTTSGAPLTVPLPLPLALPLVGAVLHQQVVPLELGAGGAITSVTATNRLTLVLGRF